MKKIIPILLGAMVFQLINYIGMQFLKRDIVLLIEVVLFIILASILWLLSYKKNRS